MAFTGQGTYTGLLGYDRTYEYLGDSVLPFRTLEKYTYTISDFSLQNRNDLPSFFKTQFANQLGVFRNNINIVSLSYPITSDHLSSSVEFQKYTVSFEVRYSGDFVVNNRDGYTGSKNLGLSGIVPYVNLLKDFRDSFSLSLESSASKSYNHDVSFSLRTGEGMTNFSSLKGLAQTIAQSIFTYEPDNLSRAAFTEYGSFNDSDSRQYYHETFNALTFDFAFSKKVSLEAFNSGNYNHSLSHSVNFNENGTFEVTEKIKVVGKSSFSQASQGYLSLSSGSLSRCQSAISSYSGILSNYGGFSNSLKNVRSSETRNIPGISIEGSFNFTNDPARQNGLVKEEDFDINRSTEGIWTINHGLKYTLDAFTVNSTDSLTLSGSSTILGLIQVDRSESPAKVNGLYSSLTDITGRVTGLFRTKTSVDSPQRGKNYSASFNYTSDPTHDISKFVDPFNGSQITGFKKLSIDTQNTLPQDLISEFKVINRPTQDSILHYGYQQAPSTFSVSFNGKIPRRGNTLYTASRYIPSGEANGLLNIAKATFLNNALLNTDVYNYYIKDFNFGCDSDNSFDMSVQFGYTKKKV